MLLAGLLAVAAIAAIAATIYVLPLIPSVRKVMERNRACGYAAPEVKWPASRIAYRICQFMQFVQTGNVQVIGLENLDNLDGPVVVTPNHVSYIDVPIVTVALNRPHRMLVTRIMFNICRAFLSLFLPRIGWISVDQRRGKGRPAADAAVRVLTNGELLVVFPEGYTYMNGVMGPLKKGTTHIGKEAAQITGKKVWFVPTFIRYNQTPAETAAVFEGCPKQYLHQAIHFWYYRRGATVVFGKPICSSEFPEDVTEATDMLAARIAELDPWKQAVPVPSGKNLPVFPDDDEMPLPTW